MERSQVPPFREHHSPWNPYSGPHSKTQCLFVVIEMSELNTDKHPADSKPSLCALLNGFVYSCVCVCFVARRSMGSCASLKKGKCKNVSPSLSSPCQPLMTQSKDRQYFMGLKLSAGLPLSWNGWLCLCVHLRKQSWLAWRHGSLFYFSSRWENCTWVHVCGRMHVLPEPAYVSNTVSPVVVTVSLLFMGSVFT